MPSILDQIRLQEREAALNNLLHIAYARKSPPYNYDDHLLYWIGVLVDDAKSSEGIETFR